MAVRLQVLSLLVAFLALPLVGLGSAGLGGVQAQTGCSAFTANLSGAQQVPPVVSMGTGTGTVVLNAAQTQITVNLTFTGLTSAANAAHIHAPAAPGANANILFPFTGVPAATSGSIPQQTFPITPAQVADLQAGLDYMNVHSDNFTGGEIRGQLQCAPACVANLVAGEEVPPSMGSSGTGTGTVVLNAAQTQITVNLTFAGLTTPANMAHIHGPALPGANANILFPFTGVPAATSGSIPQQTFAITPAQVADLQTGLHYMNVHSTNFPNGEIRGQLQCPPAPAPNATPTPTATSAVNATPTVTVTPTATPTSVPGDINGDGFVDIRDYGVWRQQFGITLCGYSADLNGDCLVDIRDYGIWRQHFGEGTPPGDVRPGVPPAPRSPSGPPGAAPAPVRTPTATPSPR